MRPKPHFCAARQNPTDGNPPASRRISCCCMLLLLCLTGCSTIRNWRKDPGLTGPCRLPKNPTVAQVVDHVNANVDKVHGWRSNSVKIRASDVPVTLGGNLVVERDHRLRLEVKSALGKEVDLGSNDEVFWIWTKRAPTSGDEPPPLIFAAHSEMDIARQKLPMPFDPEWLMEALGVAPLSAEGVQMEGTPGVAMIKLVSQHQLPDGSAVRKEVTVDGCHGRVLQQSVSDMNGRPLVRAVMGDHRLDPRTGAVLPRYVKLDWPQQQMSLAMEFHAVEVNPESVPATVWQMPVMPNTRLVNLGGERRDGTRLALDVARPRTDLIDPEDVVVETIDQGFELPQMNRSRPPVELTPAGFDAVDPPGRARVNQY